jgi:hypothetical protein
MISINVLLTTIGRPELRVRMLPSLVNQLMPHDYLTIVSDLNHKYVAECISEFNFRCPVFHIMNPSALGYWGHESRNKYQNNLMGDFIMNGDDDDRYTEGALDAVRQYATDTNKLYIFKHENKGGFAWSTHGVIQIGNIGTSCGVIPNRKDLPTWEHFYGGDGRFYEKLSQMMPYEFIDFVIYKVNDTE